MRFALENKVFNIWSSHVEWLTTYGVKTSSDWPLTVKHNTKKDMQMCRSIVSKTTDARKWTVGAGFKQQPFDPVAQMMDHSLSRQDDKVDVHCPSRNQFTC